jgi:hypothetical protein
MRPWRRNWRHATHCFNRLNKAEGRGGVATIINKRTTEWSPINDTGVEEVSYIMRADQDGRLLVCSLISQGRPFSGCQYVCPGEPWPETGLVQGHRCVLGGEAPGQTM